MVDELSQGVRRVVRVEPLVVPLVLPILPRVLLPLHPQVRLPLPLVVVRRVRPLVVVRPVRPPDPPRCPRPRWMQSLMSCYCYRLRPRLDPPLGRVTHFLPSHPVHVK